MSSVKIKLIHLIVLFVCVLFHGSVFGQTPPLVEGLNKVWYPVTITFDGPSVSEAATTFTNYRLDVTFTGPNSQQFIVPGYFAADGNAANTSATSGNKWRVKFTPDQAGTWSYTVSFLTGTNIAQSLVPTGGSGGTYPDGVSNTFVISPADPNAPGFYSKGMLRYVGEHYLKFQGNNEWFVKAGPGSPENFFAYEDFDGTVDGGGATQNKSFLGADGLHSYSPHNAEWNANDPEWQTGKGHGIIGALNYLSSIGANTLYLIPLTRNGDADDSWPWATENNFLVYDVSKLDQWAIVFEHMDRVGINADLYLCESENAFTLNNGNMGLERSIYYREFVARFGFKLATRYNLGEENGLSTAQMKANTDYLAGLDPYNHPVGSHCYHDIPGIDAKYLPMLGYPNFDGAWMQLHNNKNIHLETKRWLRLSRDANRKWVVSDDETWAIAETNITNAEQLVWKQIMAGGEGMDMYLGYNDITYNDISIEDFHRMNNTLKYLISPKNLFLLPEINVHLSTMSSQDILVDNDSLDIAPFCFAKTGTAYVLYGTNGGNLQIDLRGQSGKTFNVGWWDPRNGAALQNGSILTVNGGSDNTDIGNPPNSITSSWAAVVTVVNSNPIAVTGVTVAPTTLSLGIGASSLLTATVLPANATNKNVIWSSSNSNVMVDANGYVTGVALGNAVITVTTADGGFTASCNVTVTPVVTYTLTTNATNGGTVTPGGTYNSGTIVSLTATPSSGYIFSGWSGDLTGTTSPASVTMNSNKTVTANFSFTGNQPDVTSLTSWVSGTTNNKVSGSNRLMVVMVMGESATDFSATSVTYGGQSMTKQTERLHFVGGNRTYSAIFTLYETGVNAATSGTIAVSWSATPSSGNAIYSVLLGNVDQTTPFATANNGLTGTIITTSALAAASGDMVIIGGATENNTTLTFNNGFTKQFESNTAWGDATGGNKLGSGANETPSFTQSASGRMVLCAMVAKKSLPTTFAITASASSNGTISPGGNILVNSGASQSFTITPASGFQVDIVTVNGVSQGAITAHTFSNVLANQTINATFKPITYTITANTGLNGAISPSGSVLVNSGASQSFTILPDLGYEVDAVTVNGINQGAITTYTFNNVTANQTIDATFKAIPQYTITATAGFNGLINPSGNVLVYSGESQIFIIAPDSGYEVDSVTVNGVNQGAISSYTFNNVTADQTIIATFKAIPQYTITASADANGIISPSGNILVYIGESQSFTITPDSGYEVDSVMVNGVNQGAISSYTFSNVTADQTIIATFKAIPQYTITVSADANGIISPSGNVLVYSGASQVFTITPNSGYEVDSVMVNGVNQGAITAYTFNNVTADQTINATFKVLPQYTITASAGANGTISPSGSVLVYSGASQSFTITPESGFQVDDVTVNGVSQGAITTYTFTNVTANQSINATFKPIIYTITASAGANGTISPSGSVLVNSGASQSFTITPASGFQVDAVTVNGITQGAITTYTFTNVTADQSINATFKPIIYTITASAGANGTISPSGSVLVNSGASQGFTITPASGFQVDVVTVNGVSQGAITTYTFTNVTANQTINATFKPIIYTITASAGANGTISPSGSVLVNSGANQSFTITPASGFQVDVVTVNGVSQGAITTYTFTNITANRTINATFKPNIQTVTPLTGWVSGTTNNKVSGSNRLMLVMVMGESTGNFSATSVTYGGQSMTKQTERLFSVGSGNRSYAAIFMLKETGVNAATSGTIAVTWSATPSSGSGIYSVLLSNVNQTATFVTANNALTGTSLSTSALAAANGDMVVMCGATENNTTLTFNNSFTKQFESNTAWGDATGGNKLGSGVNETPSFTQSASGRMVLCAMVVKSTTSNLVGNDSTLVSRSFDEVEGIPSVGADLAFYNAVKVYPNPVTNKILYIDHPENVTIRIFNPQGQLMYNKRVLGTQSDIDFMELKVNGVVFVQVASDSNILMYKVLVVE
jgi:uncharacterized repeat protein (TIGR02543 family)